MLSQKILSYKTLPKFQLNTNSTRAAFRQINDHKLKLVVCASPKRAYYRPASQDALNGPPIALLLQAAAKAACFYAFVFLSPVNGS